ncbi:MAG: hypothetical protein ACRDU5_02190 [Mycobacterium sp.]
MKPRTVALLLALWCLLAIVPALVIAFFFDINPADPSGHVLLVWIVGYLLQFAVFAVLAVRTAGTDFVGWTIASLVPWSANWLAPMSPWWLLACAAILLGYSWWFYRSVTRSN